MKKGNIVTDHLILLLIVLVAGLLIIIGFSTNWGRGQENIGGFFNMSTEDNIDEDGRFDPFGAGIFLPAVPLLTKKMRYKVL